MSSIQRFCRPSNIRLALTAQHLPTFTSIPGRPNLVPNLIATTSSTSTRFLSSATTAMAPSIKAFLEATDARRTFYALEKKSTLPDSEIRELCEHAMLTVPSAFNNQSIRMTLLLHDNHDKLWTIVGDTLLKKIGQERYEASTKGRIAGFANAYGTILFWDDPGHVTQLENTAGPLYSDKAAEWTHQSNGMHQYFMWVALEAGGLGCNLQHYNPLIDEQVKETWDLPKHWNLKAQLVFGKIKEGSEKPGEKEQKHKMHERFHHFGVKG